jgi:hypothetical protein
MQRWDATGEIKGGGTGLVVSMGGRLAALCVGAAIDAGLRCVTAPSVGGACARMARDAPRVVVAPGTLTKAERTALAAATAAVGAQLVELPIIVELADVAHAIRRAIARDAAKSEHPKSDVHLSGARDDDPAPATQPECPSSFRKRTAAR